VADPVAVPGDDVEAAVSRGAHLDARLAWTFLMLRARKAVHDSRNLRQRVQLKRWVRERGAR
jgi:hypothetical protein